MFFAAAPWNFAAGAPAPVFYEQQFKLVLGGGDTCVASECMHENIFEGAICDLVPEVDEFCTADGRCVIPTGS